MAHKAMDGREFTNRMSANMHNASLRGMGKMPMTPPKGDEGPDDMEPKSLEDDDHAMRLVDQLKDMGYSPEDVHRAMSAGGDEDEEPMAKPMGKQAAAMADLNIPGMK